LSFPDKSSGLEEVMVVQKDVAARAGVSTSTVSLVLNNSKAISPEISQRVWEIARALDYHANPHARRLQRGQSTSVGLIISEIANPFFPEIIKGFEAAASAQGLELLLCNTEYNLERMEAAVSKMLGESVRGVAVMTSSFGKAQLSALVKHRIPVALLSMGCDSSGARNIEIHFAKGVFQAIDHLTVLGHRSIGVISGPTHIRSAVVTRGVMLRCLAKRGLRPASVIECNYNVGGASSAVRFLVRHAPLPTALLCGNDLIAIGAISALQEANIRVPEDVSIVGVDDIFCAALACPPLTTIHVPRAELGRLGFEILERMRRPSRGLAERPRVETHLVIRKSTSAPKRLSERVW
jgi:LacI family transcriptional regulator